MRVLDEADNFPIYIEEGVNLDDVTDFLNRLEQRMPFRFKLHRSRINILHSPVGHAAEFLSWCVCNWMQSDFVTRDIEANLERLIKIGLLGEHVRIPGFRLGDVFDVIDAV